MILIFLALITLVGVLKLARFMTPRPVPRSFRTNEIRSGHVVLQCGCIFTNGTTPRPCKAHELMGDLA